MPSFLHFETIDSTSSYLLGRVSELEDRTFVSASYQSKGKGRLSRVWESKPGENLLFSFLLKEENLLSRFADVSLLSGLSVAKAFESFGAEDVSLKWPNDVYLHGKKAAGILLEGSSLGDEIQAIVVGVGINLNQSSFPKGIEATSLSLELGKPIDVPFFQKRVYEILLEELSRLGNGDSHYLEEVRSRDFLNDKEITFDQEGSHVGRCLGIGEDGSLLVEENKAIRSLRYGEANLLRPKKSH